MKNKRTGSGFTLIELLVVIAIIALLLSIVTPALKRAQDTAKRVTCGTRLKQIGVAMRLYSDAFDGALPDDYNINGSRNRHGFMVYRHDQSYPDGRLKPFRFAYLYELNMIEVPEIFYCPGNRDELYQYKSYTHPTPWGTLPQAINGDNQWVRIGFSYFPIERNPSIDPASGAPRQQASKFIQLNPNMPYATDLLPRQQENMNHWTKTVAGLNALFPDGHVAYANDREIFLDPVWDEVRQGETISNQLLYDKFHYTIFRMIRP